MKKMIKGIVLVAAILLIAWPTFLGNYVYKTFFTPEEIKDPSKIEFKVEQDDIDKYNNMLAEGYFNADTNLLDSALSKNADESNKEREKALNKATTMEDNEDKDNDFLDWVRSKKGFEKVIGYIDIPSIDERILLFYGTDEHSLERGAGILENTSFPSHKKKNIHTVLAGHRGMTNLNVFKNVDKIKPGDELIIHVNNDKFVYKMNSSIVRDPGKMDDVFIDPEKNLLTIVTCHPYLINNQRMLVFFEKI